MCIFFEHVVHICFRGKDFRQEFSRIGEIRSLVPKDVNLMALTATANLATRTVVITSLDMHGCHVISRLPNKPNICYSVMTKSDNHVDVLQPLIDELCSKGVKSERCIVFCRTYDDTMKLFQTMVLELSKRNGLYCEDTKGLFFVTNLMDVQQSQLNQRLLKTSHSLMGIFVLYLPL